MSTQRIIKKYPNRRLYDTTSSRYVSLETLHQLVVDGESFRVLDVKTEQDITRRVLLQIIVEQEEKGRPILSVELLEKLICFYGDAWQALVAGYLETSVDSLVAYQNNLNQQWQTMLDSAPPTVFTELMKQNLAMWQSMQNQTPGFSKSSGEVSDTEGKTS